MAILSKGTTFATGDQVTATKLNNLVDSATFASGAVASGGGLSVSTGGVSLLVSDLGITEAKLAGSSVTTTKIADATITPAKLSTYAPTWSSTATTIANSLDFSAISTTPTSGTYGRSGTTVTISMTGHGMTTGMVATFTFNSGTGGAANGGTYVVTVSDANTFTITDTASGTITGSPTCSRTSYYGTSTIRGSETINGNLTVNKDASITGSLNLGGSTVRLLTRATAVNASGTFVDFTSIPSWVKRITIAIDGISTSGTTVPLLQIGAGSVSESSYSAKAGSIGSSDNATSGFPCTFGFPFTGYSSAAATTYTGILLLVNISGNTWVCSGSVYPSNASSSTIAGSIALSGSLDRVRLTTITGTTLGSGSFDAGTVNIMYE